MTAPSVGQLVRVRSRQYLVEDVRKARRKADSTVVWLSCLDDDAQGDRLTVLWDKEVDAQLLDGNAWDRVASKGFDNPRHFSAYLHALRWNRVTATNAELFQAPYRAGIEVKAYQLEPLRKAIAMPFVNLFIADDVGLGKTIEAGLILRELLMRQKVRRTVICAPPSVVRQWRDEMEQRFGLNFVIFDRAFIAKKRQQRGYGINPWTTHNQFIISHALIRNESYAGPLRDWLEASSGKAMLILDEAHNVAPSSSSKYAVDSHLTRQMREIAPRFDHKLFLSATPHNGHSNSFSALLEILDPNRFMRGVTIHRRSLEAVMVRRLKGDLRELGEAFPERQIIRVELDGLPEDAPELRLSRLLEAYRVARKQRLRDASPGQARAAMLVVTSLQVRLLSSIEAFARTLKVHRASLERYAATQRDRDLTEQETQLLLAAPDADDERADLDEEEVIAEADAQLARVSAATSGPAETMRDERRLLEEMQAIADAHRHAPLSKLNHLMAWIKANLCPDLGERGATWNQRRVVIFTEWTDTKRHLQHALEDAVRLSDQGAQRVMTFHGGIGEERREEIKAAFNADPDTHPVRILIATDAAREGVNLQNHCADLFHYDIPWNPARMEQRNGRIDRKLQRASVVRCHYYVLPQRAEDRVLDALVRKSEVIHSELGSLAPVVASRVDALMKRGLAHDALQGTLSGIDTSDEPIKNGVKAQTVAQDLDGIRKRHATLLAQNEKLEGLLATSRDWIGLDDTHFRDALTASLELAGARGLSPVNAAEALKDPAHARWQVPALDERLGRDPTWAMTLDTLRAPRKKGQKLWEWRNEAPIRPIVFRDPGNLDGEVVHLHLEHRVVQRLLSRFLSLGFADDDLSRATIVRTDTPIPKVILIGRLSLFGEGASRLHDELVAVAGTLSWHGEADTPALKTTDDDQTTAALTELEAAFATVGALPIGDRVRRRLRSRVTRDVAELQVRLEARAKALYATAEAALAKRADSEATNMRRTMDRLRDRIHRQHEEVNPAQLKLSLKLNRRERHQLDTDHRRYAERVAELEIDRLEQPKRIRANYKVQASRIDPVGLVYLWPVSS